MLAGMVMVGLVMMSSVRGGAGDKLPETQCGAVGVWR